MTRLHERFSFLDHLSRSKCDRFICRDTHSNIAREVTHCLASALTGKWVASSNPRSQKNLSARRSVSKQRNVRSMRQADMFEVTRPVSPFIWAESAMG